MISIPTFVADFETIERDGKEVVWLFDICNIVNLNHKTGTTMQEFINIIDNAKTSIKIYFHNLKFDGTFITDYLLKNGCKISEQGGKYLKKNSFYLLVTEFGSFFSLEYKNKYNKIIKIIDSLKLIPLSVSNMAKGFGLPISKGEIDYKKSRPIGYIPSVKEIEYVKHDTEIVARALNFMIENGHDKLTISSCAFNEFKEIIGKTNYSDWFGEWEKMEDITLDKEIRKAYRGGFCQVNKLYANKTVKQPIYYNDVNSLYPYIMRNCKLPVGMPKHGIGKYNGSSKCYIQKIKVDMFVRENCIPCILDKSQIFNSTKYITDTLTKTSNTLTLTLTNFDLELMFSNYEIVSLEWLEWWEFEAKSNIFTEYIDKYIQIKIQADKDGNKALRLLSKLLLNSLYGKFGQNPERCRKIPYIGIDNLIHFNKTEKIKSNKNKYLPIAVFITAQARFKILNDIKKIGYENWVYTDTDSILSLVKFDKTMINESELGKYKVEHIFKKTRVIGAKSYWGKCLDNEIVCKLCGCNKEVLKKFPIGKFNEGGIIKNGRRMLKTVDGGKRLVDIDFTIKIRNKT